MDAKTQIDTRAVYRTVADLLPAEGRDYNLKLKTEGNGVRSIVLEGLTPMGRAWLPFLKDRLENPMKEHGIGVEQVEQSRAPGEVTINSVRKSVVAEFDAKLQARILDHEKVLQDQRKANADTAATRQTEREIARLKAVQARIPALRKATGERAVKAAEAEKQGGKDLSADHDAPLNTLFDRNDVDTRFRRAEALIEKMAERAVDIDVLGESAVRELKQYALTKVKETGKES